MLNFEMFTKMMGMLCEVYNRDLTQNLLNAYYLVLKQMSDTDFKNSVINILEGRTYQALPKPAEILEYSRPDAESLATLAIQDIERAISKGGAYISITFEDIVVNSVIDALGGWVKVCQMDVDEWKWAKKEIPKLYGIYSKRDKHPNHLIGLSENANGYSGQISQVKCSYEVPKIKTVPALNSGEKKINNALGQINIKRIENRDNELSEIAEMIENSRGML